MADPKSKLNDPAAHFTRAEAMALMSERRRETVGADMTPEDHAALKAQPLAPPDPDTASDPEPASTRVGDDRPQERNAFQIAAELEAAAPAAPAAPDDPGTLTDAKPPLTDELDLTRKLKLKINGQEVERTLAEVIADAQKVSAADEYLQRSRDQLHSINLLADEVRAKLKSDPAPAPAAPADTTLEDPAEAGVAALFRGDEEAAKAAFRQLAGAREAPPALDVAAISSLVTQQVLQEQTRTAAKAAFLAAHPDADSNPFTASVANTAIRLELEKAGVATLDALPAAQVATVYATAAAALSAWRGGHTSPPAPAAPAVNRSSKKSAIDELPAASARAVTQETPPQTNSSVIAQMRASRPGSVPSSVH